MRCFKSLISLILVLSLINNGNSARILGAVFTPSYSHQLAFQPIWRELSLRGHEVTLLTTDPINDPKLTNLTEIDLSISYNVMKSHKSDEILSSSEGSVMSRIRRYMEALSETAEVQLSHPEVQNLIHNKSEHFDLLMVEAIFPTQMAFAWRFKVPFIGLISLDAPQRLHAVMGNPIHPVLYPAYDLPFVDNLSFVERVISSIFLMVMMWFGEYRLYPREDVTVRKYFGEETPLLSEIQQNMSFLFINANPVLHHPRPLMPTTIEIGGGIHFKKPKPLPQDLKTYLDEAKEGFVYFSLGTNVKSAALSKNAKDAIVGALSKLPYKVLWKFEDQNLENKPENVKIVNWVPQTAVLNHPNIRGFVTQCGLQSIEEAIFYNVPMVGLPFYGDQSHNAKLMGGKGFGMVLDGKAFTEEALLSAILEISTNNKYKIKTKEAAQLLGDQEMTGLEKAVWWTEYAIRHQGAPHLRPNYYLPLYQYYFLDVIAFLTTIVVLAFYLCFKLLKKICRRG